MAKCDVCGAEESMPYHCKHCGGTFCSEHRLPEAHDCPGLQDWGDEEKVFDSGFDTTVDTGGSRDEGGLTDRVGLNTGVGGPLAYFRGNMTYLFLLLMWITFLAQFVVGYLLTGTFDPRAFSLHPTWEAIFVLSPEHPEYVWTWVTSVFAHGGFGHIAINSIVIYFFGRLVEDYIGSQPFSYLFIVSGVLAGLGQIAIQIIQASGAGVLGASGAGLAIMGVLTVLNPSLRVYLYFIFPIPLWILTVFYVLISVLGILGTGGGIAGGNVANAAHLIGLVIGLAYGQRVKDRIRVPSQFQFGSGPGGPGGPGGPRRRGPF
jgi:membrane associated rhomboid family serine protease